LIFSTGAASTERFLRSTFPTLASGLNWSTSQLHNIGVLSVGAGLASDFDFGGDVDGRDFLVWQRDHGIGNLTDWQTNYGMVAPLSAASTAVPEPTSLLLVFAAALYCGCRRGFAS
jgi:hypothetical protein